MEPSNSSVDGGNTSLLQLLKTLGLDTPGPAGRQIMEALLAEPDFRDHFQRRNRREVLMLRVVARLDEDGAIAPQKLARDLGEKAILLLTLIEEMARSGLVEKVGTEGHIQLATPSSGSLTQSKPANSCNGFSLPRRTETARMLIALFRFLKEQPQTEFKMGPTILVQVASHKFAEIEVRPDRLGMVVYGHFPADWFERVRAETAAEDVLNYQLDAGIIKLQCATLDRLNNLMPFLNSLIKKTCERSG